ncbi:hypothetical protein HWI79_1101 [Cryptosporidium felis]|nr:hypothetical protein HWI79_1101 [Cryptosporidium felis]
MKVSLSNCYILVFFLSYILGLYTVNCELFIISKTNQTSDSWFNLELLREFLSDENTVLNSANALEGFKKMIRIVPETPQVKTSSWIPQNIREVISRINSNSKKEEVANKPILKKKFEDLKRYLENQIQPKLNSKNSTSTEGKSWKIFSFVSTGINSTIEQNDKKAIHGESHFIDGKSQTNNIDYETLSSGSLRELNPQNSQANSSNIQNQCEKNVVIHFKECIENCKSNLKYQQSRSGGITPLNISELNTCIHSCRNSANSSNCKLSASSVSLINEEIPIPKPTIRRNQRNQEGSRGLLYIYIIDPIVRFITTSIFCLLGIIVILYYFKEYRIYPRVADYITYKIESYYTEDEKRRAIFEGDGFPQQPRVNWKRTIIYFIRLNFLPRFMASNFSWLFPMRDHYQQSTDGCNYVRVH